MSVVKETLSGEYTILVNFAGLLLVALAVVELLSWTKKCVGKLGLMQLHGCERTI